MHPLPSLVSALLSLLLLALTPFHEEPARATRNVVLIVADDHGRDLGAYGNAVIQTPHLDALASEGVLFTHAFATTASCSASRSVILSGLHNHRNGQYGHQHDYHHFAAFDHVRSLPVLLQEAGYRTARVGKYHVAPEEVFHFETALPGNSRSPVEMAENSRAFINADAEQPFFLLFATSDPHRGGKIKPDGSRAAIDDTETPDNFGNRPRGYPGITEITYDPAEVIVPPYLPDTPQARAELAQYYQSVSRLDQGVGRLIAILKEAGVYEDTLILYISDHGIAFPGAKTTVYEPGLRSPLIVRHPYAQRRGLINPAMVSWVDLTPTILDFAGVAPPAYDTHIGLSTLREQMPEQHGLHGRSFLPILEEESPEGWDAIYASHTFHEIQMYYPMRVVRDRQYKLIWNITHPLPFPFASDLWESPTWQAAYQQGMDASYGPHTVRDYIYRAEFELYDMQADPWESTNLADDPQYADVLKRYQEKLRAFQIRTTDPWLLKWTYE